MADGGHMATKLRLATPLLDDVAYLARRMREDERQQFVALSGLPAYDADIAARAIASTPGPTFVVLEGDMPVLLGGFDPLRTGVYEAWLVGTDEAWSRHGHAFTRICRRAIDQILHADGHRVQVCALASRTAAHDWYERFLGMEREGVHKRHGANGEDFIMFAKVRP